MKKLVLFLIYFFIFTFGSIFVNADSGVKEFTIWSPQPNATNVFIGGQPYFQFINNVNQTQKIYLSNMNYSGGTIITFNVGFNLGTLNSIMITDNQGTVGSFSFIPVNATSSPQFTSVNCTFDRSSTGDGLGLAYSFTPISSGNYYFFLSSTYSYKSDPAQDINDSINNPSVPSGSDADDLLNDINSNLPGDNVISGLITMPITWIKALLNGLNSTCTPFKLFTIYGYTLTMPCLNLSIYFGSLWGIIDILCSGLMIFSISRKIVRIFNSLTNLNDNDVINDVFGGGN